MHICPPGPQLSTLDLTTSQKINHHHYVTILTIYSNKRNNKSGFVV